MKILKVKLKMTPEQLYNLQNEYLEIMKKIDDPFCYSFKKFLDDKYSKLIDKKIDEVINDL